MAFSSDAKTLASAGLDETIKLWDVATGKELATLKGHTALVNSVAFSSNGKTLASGSADQTIKVWDVATGAEQATLQGHTSFVFSVVLTPNGKTLASASWDQTIKLWDVATNKSGGEIARSVAVMWQKRQITRMTGGVTGTTSLGLWFGPQVTIRNVFQRWDLPPRGF